MKRKKKKEIYTTYAPDSDMTFILEDVLDEDGELISTEVIGFYFGEELDSYTEAFIGELKAIF